MSDVLFKNATIVQESGIIVGTLAVRDGKIAYIGEESPCGYENAHVIDGRAKVLMPGFVNTHVHVPMTLMRGYADDYDLDTWLKKHIFPIEDRMDERCVAAGSLLGMAEMIASGTTSFSDSYFFSDQVAIAANDCGIKANIGRALSNFDEKIDFDNFEAVKQMKKLRKDWHNADNGRIKIDAAIHAEYTSSRSLWQPLGEYAYINNMVLQVHLSETKREHEACIEKYGKTPTQLFNDEGVFRAKTIAAHCVWLTDDDIDILNENGVSVAHNPVSNLKLASGVARIPLMLRRGVNVTLGTDGVASNNNFDMFEELKLSAILHKGIEHDPKTVPAAQALALATVNGARAQGRAGECGELRVGLDADIVMIDMARVNLVPCHNVVSNLVYSARGADVCMTMVRGNILYENGAFTTIDIERVKDEIERYAIPHMFS